MAIAQVTRPRQGKIEVFIPYEGESNEWFIRRILPDGAHVTRGDRRGVWLVGRTNLAPLVQGLASHPRIHDVELNLYQGSQGGCVTACYTGSDSDEAILNCQCSCIGFNHGSQSPPSDAIRVAEATVVGEVYRYKGGMRRVMYSQLRNEF